VIIKMDKNQNTGAPTPKPIGDIFRPAPAKPFDPGTGQPQPWPGQKGPDLPQPDSTNKGPLK
jgi:hypothetical protein